MLKSIALGLGLLAAAFMFHAEMTTQAHARGFEWRYERCRFASLQGEPGAGINPAEVRMTIECAEDRWPVPGGIDYALSVASCESGMNAHADNPSSSAAGVWQFIDSTWASVTSSYADFMDRWELKSSVYNGRANSILGIRYASAHGWSAWGCA